MVSHKKFKRNSRNLIGGYSCYENLKLIGKPQSIFKGRLTDKDRDYLFDGLCGIISEVYLDAIWKMIFERYHIYEKL